MGAAALPLVGSYDRYGCIDGIKGPNARIVDAMLREMTLPLERSDLASRALDFFCVMTPRSSLAHRCSTVTYSVDPTTLVLNPTVPGNNLSSRTVFKKKSD